MFLGADEDAPLWGSRRGDLFEFLRRGLEPALALSDTARFRARGTELKMALREVRGFFVSPPTRGVDGLAFDSEST